MKTPATLLFAILLVASAANADSTAKFKKLICSGPDGDVVTLVGLGTGKLSVVYPNDSTEAIKKTEDGDCSDRKTYCSEDGQSMTNVPAELAAGEKKTGRIWINGDTDDRPENHRLGDPYDCVAAN